MSDTQWVWALPNTGTPWCTCGTDPLTGQPLHQVTRALIVQHVTKVKGTIPTVMTNQDISLTVLSLWAKPQITPVMAETLMLSVQAVHGEVAPFYATETALAIIKHFSNTVELEEES